MARRWTKKEEGRYREELKKLYIVQNKTITEIGAVLGISEKTVFDRLGRLGIKTQPHLKKNYLHKRQNLVIPKIYSNDIAEFFGIMLGDGHISHFQTMITLGNKEVSYVYYIVNLFEKIFGLQPKVSIKKRGYRTIYLGSVDLTSWLLKEGLVFNKVKLQVDVPKWIFLETKYMEMFLRGFFDTDGSVYKLKNGGVQISLTNRSLPILKSLQKMLKVLQYKPSGISCFKVYLTKRADLLRFFKEIQPQNVKHVTRFESFYMRR